MLRTSNEILPKLKSGPLTIFEFEFWSGFVSIYATVTELAVADTFVAAVADIFADAVAGEAVSMVTML